MYVRTEPFSGRPLVADLSGRDVVVRVTDISEHHVTLQILDQAALSHPRAPRLDGADVPLSLVVPWAAADALVEAVMRARTLGEVDADGQP